MTETGGHDSDGQGTLGIVAEKTRPTGSSVGSDQAPRSEDADTDRSGTGGMGHGHDAGGEPIGAGVASGGSGNALSSGLQSGGIIPGGGPGATVGSLGTGGGSDDNITTGDLERNNIEEEQL
jgi:hypothetical protein